MGKYTALTSYLQSRTENCVTLTFDRIEEIIGATLPSCARNYVNTGYYCLRFWDNVAGAAESNARLNAGFQTVMVDMENEKVRFCRIK
jgi:hypothetical protein